VRIGPIPDNLVERLVLRAGAAPLPLLETQIAYTLARVIMAGVRLGVFDALADGPGTAEEVAQRCGTDPAATGKLLFALAGAGYLNAVDGGYELAPVARKWLLKGSDPSLADKLELQFLEWDWMGASEEYVRTGQPLEVHSETDEDRWRLYQRGMRSIAGVFTQEGAKRMPVPKGATRMLDIGGSHGYWSVAICRRHDGLSAVILDLPEAVEQAAPILAAENMGDRVIHRAGDALTDDLGEDEYDLVLVSQLVHHFSEEQNRELAKRIARALRPGGVYAISDAFRPATSKQAGQTGALLEFYFALTSQSGTWSVEEMADWQRGAGLKPRRPIKLRTAPGVGILAAAKP
jgi:SAM-dependent methyltransferase